MGKNFIVYENENLKSISFKLKDNNYIYSDFLFRICVSFLKRDRTIQVGEYVFDKPQSLFGVIKKITSASPDIPLIKVTIPEGSTLTDIALSFSKVMPNFSIKNFERETLERKVEGKLFPSTYFLLPSMNEPHIIDLMVKTFEKKYGESFVNIHIPLPLNNQEEVLSMAAILEGEAKTIDDMKIVSGILLKRLSKGMLLQVDVAPETYKIKGLPLIPINNPGLNAINATLNPTTSEYFYYLTGKDGTMHYAKTFTEHKLNIQKYLK